MVGNTAGAGRQLDPAQLELERIEGELDAAIVFAITASQSGHTELGSAALSDARDGYTKVLAALEKANLSGSQLEHLRAKLMRLRGLLGDAAGPAQNVAA